MRKEGTRSTAPASRSAARHDSCASPAAPPAAALHVAAGGLQLPGSAGAAGRHTSSGTRLKQPHMPANPSTVHLKPSPT